MEQDKWMLTPTPSTSMNARVHIHMHTPSTVNYQLATNQETRECIKNKITYFHDFKYSEVCSVITQELRALFDLS